MVSKHFVRLLYPSFRNYEEVFNIFINIEDSLFLKFLPSENYLSF